MKKTINMEMFENRVGFYYLNYLKPVTREIEGVEMTINSLCLGNDLVKIFIENDKDIQKRGYALWDETEEQQEKEGKQVYYDALASITVSTPFIVVDRETKKEVETQGSGEELNIIRYIVSDTSPMWDF